jgi:site-specific DNA-methyltransferase (adenine-specific)
MNKVHFSSKNNEWETPPEIFDPLNEEFHFTLDPCATKATAKCSKFYTWEQDGLIKDWYGETVFVNPPYGNLIGKWVEKCFKESKKANTKIVALLPSRTDTRWFHGFIYGKAEIRFIKGRIRFVGAPYPAPFPSMIVVW